MAENIQETKRKLLPMWRRLFSSDPDVSLFSCSRIPWICIFIVTFVVVSILLDYCRTMRLDQRVASEDIIADENISYDYKVEVAKRFRIDPKRNKEIRADFEQFIANIQNQPFSDDTPVITRIYGKVPEGGVDSLRKKLNELLTRDGVVATNEKLKYNAKQGVRIVDEEGREFEKIVEIGQVSDPELAARKLIAALLGEKYSDSDDELRKYFEQQLIGEAGNLNEVEGGVFVNKSRKVKKGDLLVRKGDTIPEDLRQKIQEKELKKGRVTFVKCVVWTFVLLTGCVIYMLTFAKNSCLNNRDMFVTAVLIVLSISLNCLAIYLFDNFLRLDRHFIFNAIPIALCGAVLSVLVSRQVSLCASVFVSVITAFMVDFNKPMEHAIYFGTISIFLVFVVHDLISYRRFSVRTFVCTLLSTALLCVPFIWSDIPSLSIRQLAILLIVTMMQPLLVAIFSLILVFAFEELFNIKTQMQMTEMCNEHVLLDRLKNEAYHTYIHSCDVATIAVNAAKEIGADYVIVKTCALFHDIGKLDNATFYHENYRTDLAPGETPPVANPEPEKMEDKIVYWKDKAREIIQHVDHGRELALKYNLGYCIRKGIATHHGNGMPHDVANFYNRAVKAGVKLDPEDFCYHGEPVRGREMTILSLADACDAICRSKALENVGVAEKVEMVFEERLKNGALEFSEMSLADFVKVKRSFIDSLKSMRYGRQDQKNGGNQRNKARRK